MNVSLNSAGFKMGQTRPLLAYVRSVQKHCTEKTVDFSGIQTRMVRVEGERADR